MAKIYKLSDRIPVKVGHLLVKIAPLSYQAKQRIQSMMINGEKTKDVDMLTEGVILALRHCVKSIDGLTDTDNQPYKVAIENQMLTEECVGDLLNMELGSTLLNACAAFVGGVPRKFEIEGVEFVEKKTPEAPPESANPT